MLYNNGMKKLIPLFLIALLSACGGGGGGGGGAGGIASFNNDTSNPYLLRDVPYSTPTLVGNIQVAETPVTHNTMVDVFTKDLTGSGAENVVIAGRTDRNDAVQSRISIFGWSNGTLQNQTSQWFQGNDNIIAGTEPSVKFGDFLGNGKIGMYVAPSTDSDRTRGYDGAVFLNNGSSFTRTNFDLGPVWAHDSAVFDFNRDGKDDILTLDFGPNTSIAFSQGDGTFNVARNIMQSSLQGAAAVAVSDFMGDGSSQLIVTDSSINPDTATRLLSWSVTGNDLTFSDIAYLPRARFDLPKWASYHFGNGGLASHSVRVLAFDFDNSGRTSAVVISRPSFTNGVWPQFSEVQFLKNQGNGVFVDVTDTTLIGYNTKAPASYNPKLVDFNNDGLTDILLAGTSWSTSNDMQVLIHTKEHKYVASYTSVFNAFEAQASELEKYRSSVTANSNITNIIVGPNRDLYLVTVIDTFVNGKNEKAIYLSKIGAQTPSAQATVNAIKQAWPYLSPGQVNETLAKSTTTWLGFNVLDADKALSPIGSLGLNQYTAFNGYVTGINLKNANAILFDSIGRSFGVDLSPTTFQNPNMFGRNAETFTDDTRGGQPTKTNYTHFYTEYGDFKFGGDNVNQTASIGITNIPLGDKLTGSVQYTSMPFSPWIQMDGDWGKVKRSSTFETSFTKQYNNWIGRAGVMRSNTLIEPGLVTSVNTITSVWSEAGYSWGKLKTFAGYLPKVIDGQANIKMPHSIDYNGNVSYNNVSADIVSPTVRYIRFSYTDRIKKKVYYQINGIRTDTNQFSLFGALKINF